MNGFYGYTVQADLGEGLPLFIDQLYVVNSDNVHVYATAEAAHKAAISNGVSHYAIRKVVLHVFEAVSVN